MQQKKISFFSASVYAAAPVYLLLSIAGLSFCFFLGFPFDNHNESYNWIPIISKVSFWDTLSRQVIHIESFRPLGMANAWLSYRLSGNIYLQEILNWLFAIASIALLFNAVQNKMLFSVLSFITAACFFSGYIYLFHLHGVFYGPFQLYVAALSSIAYQRRRLSGKLLALTAAATLVISLYHTFALLVFCAFVTGYLLQVPKTERRKALLPPAIVLLLTLLLASTILHAKHVKSLQELKEGFLVSYQMAEVNKALSLVALVLSVLVSLITMTSTRGKLVTSIITVLLAAAFMYWDLPILLLWIGICLVKTITEKNWVMAGLLAATAILPLGSASGSPTYVVFVLMICTFVTASGEGLPLPELPFVRKLILGCIFALFGCLLALKAGLQVPLVTGLARPIMAEAEKTHQLKEIIAWKLKSASYEACSLKLFDAVDLPVNATNAIARSNRPVTDQANINNYIDYLSNDTPNASKRLSLYITFGNEPIAGKELVFSVKGRWNGPACVYQ